MKKALILGVKGQDGSLLANHLLKKKYKVTGISRTKFKNQNLIKLKITKNLKILHFNYSDKKKVQNLLKKNNFDEIYFLAGQPLPNISNTQSLNPPTIRRFKYNSGATRKKKSISNAL